MKDTSHTRLPFEKRPLRKYKHSTEREKALKAFQRARKLQETNALGYGKCWTCGKEIHISEADGGHGIPRNHVATELEPSNCHLQCRECNRMMYGRYRAFMEHIAQEYGQSEVLRLERMDRAYNGSEEDLLKLSYEDMQSVKAERTGTYYHEKYLVWSRIVKELEKRNG